MLTAGELVRHLVKLDENTPVFVPSEVGYEPANSYEIEKMYFRGSFLVPGQWLDEQDAKETLGVVERGYISALVIR